MERGRNSSSSDSTNRVGSFISDRLPYFGRGLGRLDRGQWSCPVATKITPGPPMDLGNMRQNGVRSISVHCIDCGRDGIVKVDAYPAHLAVKIF
jgi:hypothetical protein